MVKHVIERYDKNHLVETKKFDTKELAMKYRKEEIRKIYGEDVRWNFDSDYISLPCESACSFYVGKRDYPVVFYYTVIELMDLDYISIKKHLNDSEYLEEKIKRFTKIVNGDDAIITSIDVDIDHLVVDYDYFSHGYRYDDGVVIPLKLLTASDEELYEHKRKLLEMYKKKAEEDKKKLEEDKIKEEKALLKKLKAKYEG